MIESLAEKNEQIGCMNGFFQLFDRRHRRIGRITNGGLSQNTPPLLKPEANKVVDKEYKETRTILKHETSTSLDLHNKSSLARKSVDLRDVVKECMRRDPRGPPNHIDSPRPRLPYDGTESRNRSKDERDRPRPRLSYDGTESRNRSKDDPDRPRLSLDSRPTRLSNLRIDTRSGDQALPQEPGSSRRASSVVARLMGLVDPPPPDTKKQFPVVEAAPWKTNPTVLAQIEKRLADLEFNKSGKDLRALKQILHAMHNTKPSTTNLAVHRTKKPIVIMTPACNNNYDKTSVEKRSVKSLQTHKTSVETTSPRLSPKRIRVSSAGLPHYLNTRRKQISGRQSPECKSPVRKLRTNSLTVYQGNVSPLRSESNVSVRSEDIDGGEVTSVVVVRRDQNPIIGLTVNKKMVDSEQPSPVSVLDSMFYRDESPSPVKKTSNAFKDDEILYPDETEWELMDLDQQSYGGRSSIISESDRETRLHLETTHPDHIYISDILSASDLPINPKLFYALENHGIARPRHEKLHRKLVFDVVTEIMGRKLARGIGNKQPILGDIYSEIDRLQGKDLGEDQDFRLERVVSDDMARQPMNWREYRKEVPAVVLDIERLIFKDLVTELINDLKTRPRNLGHRKQLIFN